MRAITAMTRDVVCVLPSDSLSDAHQIMIEWEIRHLPVLEGTRLVGILSDRDIMIRARMGDDGMEIDDVTVGEAMTPDPITCAPGSAIASIGSAMTRHKIDSLPVVDADGALVGLVTSTDLIEILVGREEADASLPLRFEVRAGMRPGSAARA